MTSNEKFIPKIINHLISLSLCFCLTLFCGALAPQSANAEVQHAPNSHVKLDLPEGFSPSGRFSGFINKELGISIVIAEFPEQAFAQFQNAFTPQALGGRGITDVKNVNLDGKNGKYIFVTGIQNSASGPVSKYMLSIVNKGITALITANVPKATLEGKKIDSASINNIMNSAVIVEQTGKAKELYRMTYLGRFHERTKILGATKGYELKPEKKPNPAQANKQPKVFFIVSPSTHLLPVPNLNATSNLAFKNISGLENIAKKSEKEFEISSLKSFEIVGSGKDVKTGLPTLIFQTMIAASQGGYYRIMGFAPENDKKLYLEEFRKMTAGFTEVK